MKIKTFSELREAAKDKAAKAQATTKDKESDLFGTSRIKGEQDFRDDHGMDVQIKANKLKDNDHFSPNLKPATHRADGEKNPIRQGNSSQPGPTKLFQVKEEEQIDESLDSIAKKHGMKYTTTAYGAGMKHPTKGEISINRYGEWHHKGTNKTGDSEDDFSSLDKHLSTLKEEEQIDENKITHTIAKKYLKPHKLFMHAEGFPKVITQPLPKGHPDERTHIGIIARDPREFRYHSDGAYPIKEENIEMNEDVFSSLKALASSNKSGNLKFKNGETGLVNSKSAGKIVDAYNKLSPENAKQMKAKMNSDVVGFMKVLHFVDKSAKAV